MSDVIRIEGSEANFTINVVGNITKETYMGKYKVKCILSPLEEIEADKIYRELLGNNYHLSDENIKQKAFALAQLKVRVLEYPPFWDNDFIGGGHVPDSNVILDVLELAIESQEKFIKDRQEDMKRRQDLLTNAINKKQIEKEPEIDNITDEEFEAQLAEEEMNKD